MPKTILHLAPNNIDVLFYEGLAPGRPTPPGVTAIDSSTIPGKPEECDWDSDQGKLILNPAKVAARAAALAAEAAKKNAPPQAVGNSVPELRSEVNAIRQALIDAGLLNEQ